jgi:hypothetical protein
VLALAAFVCALAPARADAVSSYPVNVLVFGDICGRGWTNYEQYDVYYFALHTIMQHGDCSTHLDWPVGALATAANVYDSGYPAHFCGHYGNYYNVLNYAGANQGLYATSCYGALGVWGYHWVAYGYPTPTWYQGDAMPGFVAEYI